jgi:hypothetical protein
MWIVHKCSANAAEPSCLQAISLHSTSEYPLVRHIGISVLKRIQEIAEWTDPRLFAAAGIDDRYMLPCDALRLTGALVVRCEVINFAFFLVILIMLTTIQYM